VDAFYITSNWQRLVTTVSSCCHIYLTLLYLKLSCKTHARQLATKLSFTRYLDSLLIVVCLHWSDKITSSLDPLRLFLHQPSACCTPPSLHAVMLQDLFQNSLCGRFKDRKPCRVLLIRRCGWMVSSWLQLISTIFFLPESFLIQVECHPTLCLVVLLRMPPKF